MALPYPGLIPSNVNKDAKYSVVHGADGMEVRLIFQIDRRERVILSTDHHEELVAMVNAVKTEYQGSPGGAFYINEYYDVVVPTLEGHFFAGVYDEGIVEFRLDGLLISPRAPEGLEPGDVWPGPHVGVRYVLAAGGSDVYYTLRRGNREIRDALSDHVGKDAASALAQRLARTKGGAGGRLYINECGEFFTPGPDRTGEFVYLGGLDEDAWFPAPDVPRD